MDCISILALGLFLSAPPVEEVRRAAADVLSAGEIQSRYPVTSKQPAPRRKRERERKTQARAPEGVAAEALLWVLLVAGLALAAIYLGSRLGGYTADLKTTGGTAGQGIGARAPPPATEAERLAAEGRYEEAIHALLLLALYPLTEEEHLAGSLTSREILRTVELPPAVSEPIGGLVQAVELSVFGGRPPDRGDYDRCAGLYAEYCAALGLELA